MDNHTPEQRKKNMQAVRNKDSAIEVALRKELWSRGIRYRKNVKTVFGNPDIAFIGKKSRCSVTASSGMDLTGKIIGIASRPEESFGFPKSKGICNEIKR